MTVARIFGNAAVAMTDRRGAPPTDPDADADLLARWRGSRDEDAFDRLSGRHAPWVRGVCRRRLADPALVEDAVQAVFILLARGGPRDGRALPAWLLRVAISVCAQALRAESRRRRHEAVAAQAAAPGGGDGDDEPAGLRAGLDEAIAALRPAQRAAVVGYYLQGLPQAEVARQLGCSEDAVKMRVQYALGKLRTWFAKRGLVIGGGAIAAALAKTAGDAGGVAPVAAGVAAHELAEAAARAALPLKAAAVVVALAGAVALATVALRWSRSPEAPASATLAIVAEGDPAPARRRLPDDPFVRPERGVEIAAGIDRLLFSDALVAAPTSIWADPEAAAWRTHVDHEVRRWWRAVELKEDAFPLIEALDGAQRSLVQMLPRRAGDQQTRWLFASDLGSAAPAVRAWDQGQPRRGLREKLALGPYTGVRNRDVTTLWRDEQWIFGSDGEVGAHAQRAHAALPGAPDVPLWLRWDGAPLLAALTRMAAGDAALAARVDAIAPGWRQARPQLDGAIDVDRGAWRTRATITGAPQPWLRPIAPELAVLVPTDGDVVLALGLDPAAVARAMAALGVSSPRADLEARAALATGDVLVVASWATPPIPTGAVCALVRDPPAVDRMLDDVLVRLRAAPMELRGARRAWRLATPIGAVTVARAGARLVAGNDPNEVDRLLGGAAAKGGRTGATAFCLKVDLAKAGAVILPLLFTAARGSEQTLGPDPFFSLGFDADFWGFAFRAPRRPGSLWEAATGHRGGRRSAVGVFRLIFGREGLQAAVDRSLTLLRAPGKDGSSPGDHQLVMRTADGYLCSGRLNPAIASRLGVTDGGGRRWSSWRWRDERQARTFSPGEAAAAFAGWTRLAGPGIADLPVIVMPEPVVMDQRWLPPIGVLLRHLPVTEIIVEVHGDRVELSERGAPVLAAGLTAGVLAGAGVTDRLQQAERRAETERHEREVWAKHAGERRALDAIVAAIERDHAVERLSALVQKGILRVEDCAPLFAGRIPTVDELDDLLPLCEPFGQHQTGDWRLVYPLDAVTWAAVDYSGEVTLGSGDLPEVGRPRESEPVAPGPRAGDF